MTHICSNSDVSTSKLKFFFMNSLQYFVVILSSPCSKSICKSLEKRHMGIIDFFPSFFVLTVYTLVHFHLANGNNDSQYVPYNHNTA